MRGDEYCAKSAQQRIDLQARRYVSFERGDHLVVFAQQARYSRSRLIAAP